MSIYKFDPADAERFAREKGFQTRRSRGELVFTKCPYCGATTDKKNKFAINLSTGQFNCFRASCGMHGNMITLSRDFGFSLGKDVDTYYSTVDYTSKQYKKFRDAHRKIEARPKAIEYMLDRGIPEDITKKYEITTQKEHDNVLVFPFKDEAGEMTFVKYRNMEFIKGETNGSKEWCEKNCKPILFGMNHCDSQKSDEIIITEGQIDSLSVVAAGFQNAVSVPTGARGFTWFPYCYNFLNSFTRIIVMGDCENGKITLVDELAKRFPKKVRVCRTIDYQGCKDANELLKKHGAIAVKQAIENAEAPYNAHIKLLSQVKQVDIMKMEAISTGMREIDNILDGGFRFGQLAILTGKRGLGKSTIASMWAVRALDQNYKCFFYSGELPDFFFRNWMDCQVTGKGEHTQSENDQLDAWYGDKACIYDNSTVVENDEYSNLIDVMEIAIIQHGCRFLLLDNLMTAIEDDLTSDLYRAQSKFIGNLSALAKKYNVFILLIAHPRKTSGQIENDDISGSSNITDRADIVLVYGKPAVEEADIDENHRRLRITKNRLTGRLTKEKEPIKLCYDNTGSRRIATSFNDFRNIRFNWDNDPYDGFEVQEELPDEIPF